MPLIMKNIQRVSEIVVYQHPKLQHFFANVSLNFFNSNYICMAFAHVAILLSFRQRSQAYLMALKDFDYSYSIGYKRPITSKK